MSTILEHFKPPPLASDPPAKTRFWPAPPTTSKGGILQRPKPASNISVSASSSSSLLSVPPAIPPASPSVSSSRVSFAPLPDLTTRKRRNSITLGVAARSAALRKMKERNGPPPPNAGPGGPGAGPRPPIPRPHPRSNSASLGRRSGGGGMQYTYQSYQAGLPRPRRPPSKDDQVIDLGEVAIDAGKKLWRVVKGKKEKGQKSSSAASDSGRPEMGEERGVGGPTVGASGHNTEREILVRGFAVPEDVVDEDEEEDEEARKEDVAETQAEAQHRTEDYVAGMQSLQLYDEDAEDAGPFAVDPSAVSPTAAKTAESIEPGAIHSTRLSPPPPPPLTPESEASDLTSADESLTSSLASPNVEPRSIDDPPNEYIASEAKPQPPGHGSSLF